jgi:hypothetical protein
VQKISAAWVGVWGLNSETFRIRCSDGYVLQKILQVKPKVKHRVMITVVVKSSNVAPNSALSHLDLELEPRTPIRAMEDINAIAKQFTDFYYSTFDTNRANLGNLYVCVSFPSVFSRFCLIFDSA